jgi:hypothetical protein
MLFAKLRPRERLVSVPLCYAKHLVVQTYEGDNFMWLQQAPGEGLNLL